MSSRLIFCGESVSIQLKIWSKFKILIKLLWKYELFLFKHIVKQKVIRTHKQSEKELK